MPPPPSSPDSAERLFAEHLQKPLAEQEAQFEELCDRHPALAARLRSLDADRRALTPAPSNPPRVATVRLQPGPAPAAAPPPASHTPDTSAEPGHAPPSTDQGSRYTQLGELGRGGMGVVLRVFDTVLRRELAMKVLLDESQAASDVDRQQLAKRFVTEATVTGGLEHPGIVPVYDLLTEPTGRVSFTMPIIEGADLLEVIRQVHAGDAEWTLPRAVGVILKVCEAVAFAHSRGVLHRDLTPANVRIGKFGEVHVIDWGLAKVLGQGDPPAGEGPATTPDPSGSVDIAQTLHGTVLGTPAYMPPEQADGRLDEISARSDVYAVGAMLYHLLAGVAPFTSRRRTLSPERIVRLVRRGSPPPIERLNRSAPPELVAIAERAMARRPEDRYADMIAMAEDLRAYGDGRVVPTYERGVIATLRKLILRNRIVSAVVAVAMFAIVFNLIEFAVRHFTEKQRLEAHNAELRLARDNAVEAVQRAEAMRIVAQQHEQQARRGAYVAGIVSADTSLRGGDVAGAKLRLRACAEDLRRWEWSHLQLRADGSLLARLLDTMPTAVATVAGSARIWIGREDGQIEAWDLESSTRTHHIDTGDKPVQTLRATADGAVSIALRGGGVTTWNPSSGELHEVDTLATLDIAVLPELLACATDGSIVTWRGAVRTTLAPALPQPPRLAVLSRDGEYVATLHHDDEVLVRSTTDGATLALVPAGDVVTAIGLGSSRRLLALGTAGGAIRLHSTENGELLDVLSSVPAAVRTLAFDAAEQRLLASGEDHVLRVWNLLERDAVELRGHEREVVGTGFAGVDDLIISASRDGTWRVWSASGGVDATAYRGFGSPLASGVFAADGELAYFGTSDGFVVGRDTLRTRTTHLWQLDEGVANLSIGAGGRLFALLADGRLMRLLVDDLDAVPAPVLGPEGGVACLCASRSGLVCGGSTGRIELRSEDGESVVATWMAHAARLIDVDAQADKLATIAEDQHLRIWRLPSGERVADLTLKSMPRTVALRPDGEAVAVDSGDAGVLIFDLTDGSSVELHGHQRAVGAIAWCGNVRRLATGSDDGTMCLWDLETNERLLTDRHHGGAVHTVAFDSGGNRLLTVSRQFGSLILESEPGLQRAVSRRVAHRAEQTWAEVLRTLFDRARSEEEVMADLRSREDVPAAELRLALILARTRTLRASRLRAEVWEIVRLPGAAASRYHQALAKARAATALVAGDPLDIVMEGAALLRCRRPEQALAALQRIKLEDPAVLMPAVAFLALASAATGDTEAARGHGERLREALATLPAGSVRHAELVTLLAEVDRATTRGR